MKRHLTNKPAFTLLELLFAIILMGVMLSITLVAIIGMLRFYVFSNQVRQNQENGRNMLDTMARDIRFGQLLYPKDPDPISSKVCVLDKAKNQLVQYEHSGLVLNKTIFNYSPAAPPSNCDLGGGVSIKSGPTAMNLDKMKVTTFTITKTKGAPLATATDATTAVVIKLKYLTGQTTGSPPACKVGDIYCTSLELNTAVNIRGKAAQ